jgi:hypothetical protein
VRGERLWLCPWKKQKRSLKKLGAAGVTLLMSPFCCSAIAILSRLVTRWHIFRQEYPVFPLLAEENNEDFGRSLPGIGIAVR